jgi:hypothetical protein
MASDSESTTISMEHIVSSIKTFESPELFKLLKALTIEAEKRVKTISKSTAGAKATSKKTGSMPKGVVPPQLKKPRAWVEFTLKNALENGWESFTVLQKRKDKETNTITEEQIEMPASILHNGAYIYEDSITDKTPEGRQIIHKEAMSLSKQRKESGHPTHAAFEAQYVDDITEDDKTETSSTSSKKIIVKKTSAEKEAEKAAAKAVKEAEKAAAKAAKEAERAAKKAEKEAEKAAKKAEKEAEKAAAKEAKEAEKAEKEVKKPVVKASVPTAAIKKPVEPVEPIEPVAEKAAAVPAPKKKPAPKVEERSVPNDGMVHPCTIKGKKYLRNAEGETWLVGADDGIGAWAGIYDAKTDKLDTSAPEPVFDA